jgi:hypothetical protein
LTQSYLLRFKASRKLALECRNNKPSFGTKNFFLSNEEVLWNFLQTIIAFPHTLLEHGLPQLTNYSDKTGKNVV